MEDKLKIVEKSLDKVITPYASMKRHGDIISFVYKDINTLLKDKEDLIKTSKELEIADFDTIVKMIDDIYKEFIIASSSDMINFPDLKGDAVKVYNSLNVINTVNYLIEKYIKEDILSAEKFAHLNNILDIEFNDLDRLLTSGKASKHYLTGREQRIRVLKKIKAVSDEDKVEYYRYMLLSNEEYDEDYEKYKNNLAIPSSELKRFYIKLKTINNYLSEIDSLNQHLRRVKIYESEDAIENIINSYNEINELLDLPFTESNFVERELNLLNEALMNINGLDLRNKLGAYVDDLKFYYIEDNKLQLKSNKLLDRECNFVIDLITKDINKNAISLSSAMEKINYLVKYFIKLKEIINRVRSVHE